MSKYARFSLGSFLLLVTLICVSVSHYRVSHENRLLSEEFRYALERNIETIVRRRHTF